MPPPAMLALDDGLDNEWKGFTVLPEENPNPNYNLNFLVKKAILEGEKTAGPIFSRPTEREDSFRMVLPPAMPLPRDSAVPLPMLPEPMRIRKKLSQQESSHFTRRKTLSEEEGFKCNAFCLSLPGFGKQKSKRQDSMEKKMISTSSFTTTSTVSTRSSVEIFDCGSWAPRQDNGRRSFDFPVGMKTCKSSGGGNGGRYVQESAETSPQRRVRFSTPSSASVSCPTSPRASITPRLRKARDEFNAFLSAQDA